MKTRSYWQWELPETIYGNAVIVDVNAASSNICLILARKVKELFIANDKNVYQLKEKHKDSLVIGESKTLPKSFFDVNNCTNNIAKLKIENSTVLYMSNNGSKAIETAMERGAKHVLACSFTNIHAIYSWIRKRNEDVILIAAGDKGVPQSKALEDSLCINALESILGEKEVDWNSIINQAKSFIAAHYSDFTEEESILQLTIDMFPVLPLCIKNDQNTIRISEATP